MEATFHCKIQFHCTNKVNIMAVQTTDRAAVRTPEVMSDGSNTWD